MNSRITEDYLNHFAQLPDSVKKQARKAYRLWKTDPYHPSLHFKQVHPVEPLYSVKISRAWRVLGLLEDNTVYWFWVGTHSDYDKLITQL